MKNMSVRSREKSIFRTPSPKSKKKLCFIDEVQELYQIMSSKKHEPGFPSKLPIIQLQKKKQRLKRTRSKSGRKRKTPPSSPIRKSKRIATSNINEEKYYELDRQPLWNAKKLRQNTPRKILSPLKIVQIPIQKVQPHQPLYQFYSQYDENIQIDEIKPKKKKQKKRIESKKIKQSQNLKITQNKQIQNFDEIKEPSNECDNNNQTNQFINDENCDPTLLVTDGEIENWIPDKSFGQLIKVQQIIDEYFLFKTNFRSHRTIQLEELIKFVRDIQGYYFDRCRFERLNQLNPCLYKLFRMNGTWYIKSPLFKETDIPNRIKKTKISMIRFCRKEAKELN